MLLSASISRRRRSRRDREGAAAVEFAMVAMPFFLMIFAILEVGVAFVVDAMMETAASDAARLIRTGQADRANFDPAQFKSAFCDRMGLFKSGCESRTQIDVQVIPQFAAPPLSEPDPEDFPLDQYDGGDPGDLVLVRIWYKQTLFTPLLSQASSSAGPGKVMLTATTAFRNEPWNA